MGEGTSTPILIPILVLVAASVLLAALAIRLSRSGQVTSRAGRIALVIVALAPLFGGGLYMYAHHLVLRAENVTAPGVNGEHPARDADQQR